MEVYTIIVTFNGLKWIEKTITSVIDQSNVIVVDNHSTDNTVNHIKKYFPNVILLPQNTNFGFGVANNIGIAYAIQQKADAVFLLNQDAYADSKCIEKLIRASKLNKKYGIISPVHLNGDGSKLDRAFFNLTSSYSGLDIISDLIIRNYSKTIYPLKFINAAAWFIPVEVFYKVGGFDPLFFMYGEDVNYSQRVLYHGYNIGVIPQSIIFHDSGNDYFDVTKKNQKKYIRNFKNNFLVKYADVNTNNYKKIWRLKLYLIKVLLRKVMFLDFFNANLSLKQFKTISTINVKQSVVKNRLEGLKYLHRKM